MKILTFLGTIVKQVLNLFDLPWALSNAVNSRSSRNNYLHVFAIA